MRVGLFDSGIGGLTVLRSLIKRYPDNEYIYFGDTANLPYGSKSIDELKKLAKHNVELLLSFNVDLIVIACGTVSSNCLDYLKSNYNIPIIDIISPTINYLNNAKYSNVGVIATEATINSHIFKNNINKCVYEIATPELVPLIESNNLNNIDNVLEEYLDNYKEKIDVLVLGCTHYPLLYKYFNKYKFSVLDMAELINIDNNGNGKVNVYFSKVDKLLINNVKNILGNDIEINEIEY